MSCELFYDALLALEENLRVESADKQREIETLQEVITSMSLQLREKEKEIEELQQSLKSKLL